MGCTFRNFNKDNFKQLEYEFEPRRRRLQFILIKV